MSAPLDKYQALQVVGKGSYGKAVLAKRKADGKKCIIKQISFKTLSRKEQQKAHQEGLVLSKLQHPNIVGYWENFVVKARADTTLCIVMEYADGGDLENYLKKRYGRLLQESQVLDWFVQICLAVKHIHDRKILHRDLKTQNIFLTSSGIVKVGDFGIARVLSGTMEQAQTAIGTPYYMSPEIMQEKKYNSKSDIWSLGCILYEMCALRHPFEASTMKGLIMRIVRGAYAPLPSAFSRPLNDCVKQMLTVEPRQRASINQVLRNPVVGSRINAFLSDAQVAAEFSHTILHGEHVLRGEKSVASARSAMPSIPEMPKPRPQPSRLHQHKPPPQPQRVPARQKSPASAVPVSAARKPAVPVRQPLSAGPVRKPGVPAQRRPAPQPSVAPVRQQPNREPARVRKPISKVAAPSKPKPPVPVVRRAPAKERVGSQPPSLISPKPPSYPVQRQQKPMSNGMQERKPQATPVERVGIERRQHQAHQHPSRKPQEERLPLHRRSNSDSSDSAVAASKAAPIARVGAMRPPPLERIQSRSEHQQQQHGPSSAPTPTSANSPAWLQKLNGQISEVKKQVSQIQRKIPSPSVSSLSTTDEEQQQTEAVEEVFLTAPPPEPKMEPRKVVPASKKGVVRAPPDPVKPWKQPPAVRPGPSARIVPNSRVSPAFASPNTPSSSEDSKQRAAKMRAQREAERLEMRKQIAKQRRELALQQQQQQQQEEEEIENEEQPLDCGQAEQADEQMQHVPEYEIAAAPRVLLRVDSEDVSQITFSEAQSTESSRPLRESPSVMSAFGGEQIDGVHSFEDIEEPAETADEVIEIPDTLRISQGMNRSIDAPTSVKTIISDASDDEEGDGNAAQDHGSCNDIDDVQDHDSCSDVDGIVDGHNECEETAEGAGCDEIEQDVKHEEAEEEIDCADPGDEAQLLLEKMQEAFQLTLCDNESDDEFGSESSDNESSSFGSSQQEQDGEEGEAILNEVLCDLDAWEQTAFSPPKVDIDIENEIEEFEEETPEEETPAELSREATDNEPPQGTPPELEIDDEQDVPTGEDVRDLRTQLEEALGFQIFFEAYRFLKSITDSEDDDEAIMARLERIVGLQKLVHLGKLFQLINLEEQLDHLHGVGRWQAPL